MTEVIRRVRPGDEMELTAMIHELAEFERATDECTVTESQLRKALFGDQPTVHGHIAEVDGQAAAGALWFRNFSTWDGVAGIYLEDLYVRPQFRRRGLARKMLAALAARMRRGRLHAAVMGGAGLERQRDLAVRHRRRQAAERLDHLPGVRAGVVGAGRRILSAQPLQRGRAEQQSQCGQCHQRHRNRVEPLVRPDSHVPGNR